VHDGVWWTTVGYIAKLLGAVLVKYSITDLIDGNSQSLKKGD
jgi:hypothetical protein